MAVRYDFECSNGHQFTIWSDDARRCPSCESEFLKRVFVEPPMVNSGKTKVVDHMVRQQLESMGITNIQGGGHEGDREKVTYKSTPAQLAAQKIEKDFPQMNDPNGLEKATKQIVTRWSDLGVKGIIKGGFQPDPILKNAIPQGTIESGGKNIAIAPAEPNQFRIHDSQMVRRQIRKDPENLQVKK